MISINNRLPSNRKFGLMFSAIFAFGAGYVAFSNYGFHNILFFTILSVILLTIATLYPAYLAPLNKAWMTIGILMGKICNPIILAFIYFLVLTPYGIFGRILGRDQLRLKKVKCETYWVNRSIPGPDGETFHKQF